MKKLTRITYPSYVKGFKCIGGDCEDSCCIGWDIDIDKLTYRKYFRTNNTDMKKEFIKHVYRNEYSESEEVDYGKVRIRKNKWCPFLDDQKLCKIYSQLGEDNLSNVCYSYPRVYNILDNAYELSLYMSCPEAIRKMLSQKDKIQFIQEDIKLERYIIHSFVNTKDCKWNRSPIKELSKLRSISINAIQDRKYPVTERLLKLGYKLNKSDSLKQYNRDVENSLFQMEFLWKSIRSLKVFTEIDSPVFVKLTKKIMEGFKLKEKNISRDSIDLYKQSLSNIVEPFYQKNGHLFEHYLVNFIFQNNFPFTENKVIFDGYLMLVVRYVFIRFYLAGIAAVEGKITDDDVVLIIQVYTKTVEHHKTYIMDTLTGLKDKKLNNMDFVSRLLT